MWAILFLGGLFFYYEPHVAVITDCVCLICDG